MIGKLIHCTVSHQQRECFSTAQQAWQGTAQCRGFHGQWGGWDQHSGNALVLAHWQDQQCIADFMQNHHDRIYAASQQQNTYTCCVITYLKQMFLMPAAITLDNQNDRPPSKPGLMRIADCLVLPQARPHFIDVQQTIWAPNMANAPGMLGGHFWQSIDDANRFVVTTFWSDSQSHQRYVKTQLPDLKVQAGIEQDLKHINGYTVLLENNWTVASIGENNEV